MHSAHDCLISYLPRTCLPLFVTYRYFLIFRAINSLHGPSRIFSLRLGFLSSVPFWLSSVHFSLSSVRAFYLRCIFGYLGCSVSIFGHIFFIFGRLRCSFDVSWGRIVLLSHSQCRSKQIWAESFLKTLLANGTHVSHLSMWSALRHRSCTLDSCGSAGQ